MATATKKKAVKKITKKVVLKVASKADPLGHAMMISQRGAKDWVWHLQVFKVTASGRKGYFVIHSVEQCKDEKAARKQAAEVVKLLGLANGKKH